MGFLDTLFKSVSSLFGGGGGGGTMGSGSSGGGGGFGQILGQFLPQIVGQQTAPKVQQPNFNTPGINAFKNFQPGASVSPAQQEMIRSNVNANSEIGRKELLDTYRSARPGFDPLTDSAYIRDNAKFDKQVQDNLANELVNAGVRNDDYAYKKAQSLAEFDYQNAMRDFSESNQDANNYKQSFTNFGNSGGLMDLFKLLQGGK